MDLEEIRSYKRIEYLGGIPWKLYYMVVSQLWLLLFLFL